MKDGSTFLNKFVKTFTKPKRHLMIIIAHKLDEYLAVPLNTWRNNAPFYIQDDTCLLYPNDHPFIKYKS